MIARNVAPEEFACIWQLNKRVEIIEIEIDRTRIHFFSSRFRDRRRRGI